MRTDFRAVLKRVAILSSVLMSSLPAFSEESIRLGQVYYGGDGCPAGSASSTVSPDGKSLSILFDQFSVRAGGSSGPNSQRKSCNVSIPVLVPGGYSVSVFSIDYRGFVNVPGGAQAQMNVEYFFAGRQGPLYTKTFEGPNTSDYLLNNQLEASNISWSACGESVILRTNASLYARTNSARSEVQATVDSADVSAGIKYHILYRSCDPAAEKRSTCDIKTFNGDQITPVFTGTRTECVQTCAVFESPNPYRSCVWDKTENVVPKAGCEIKTWSGDWIVSPFEGTRGECYGRCMNFETPNPFRSCRWNGSEDLAPRGSCDIKTFNGDQITPIFDGTAGQCYSKCREFDEPNPYRSCRWSDKLDVAEFWVDCEIRSRSGALLTPVFKGTRGSCLAKCREYKGIDSMRSCRWGSDFTIPNDL